MVDRIGYWILDGIEEDISVVVDNNIALIK